MLFFTVVCFASASATSENSTEFFNATANITVVGNGSVELERIVQPSHLFEQAQALSIPTTNFSFNSRKEDSAKLKDFRPSPQLETYYEYNKVPVVPAFPEAKRFSSLIVGEKPGRPWIGFERTTETSAPWLSKVKFPTQQSVTSKDHPYPFVLSHPVSSTEYPVKYRPPNFDFPVQKIPGTVSPALYIFPGYGESSRYGGLQHESIDKFERGPVLVRRPILEKTNLGLEERPTGDVSGVTWKKIVKFLTTAIPIGILISALTPSVINVSPVNTTQKNRARSKENESGTKRQLISSLNLVEDLRSKGCEERILCELLVDAGSSGNAKQIAENLLETFIRQEGNIKKKSNELKSIMESVKVNNCEIFACRLENKIKRKLN